MKFSIFASENILCILHGQVFIMKKISVYFSAVRLCKDRLALVKNAVQSKPGAYKQKQKVCSIPASLKNVDWDIKPQTKPKQKIQQDSANNWIVEVFYSIFLFKSVLHGHALVV